MAKPKLHHKIAFSALSILVLLFLAGFVYVFITDESAASTANNAKAPPQEYKPLPKPAQPAANDPEGAYVESLDTPVTLGSNTSLIVQTNAGSTCDIAVLYAGVKATDSGLIPKKADAYGTVTWTWSIPENTPLGTWPVNVTCYYHSKSGFVQGELEVIRS